MNKIINYNDYVRGYSDNFVKVLIDDDSINKIKSLVKHIIEQKQSETHHIKDSGSEQKRWLTGFLGERAVEKYFDIQFMDFSIGDSKKYHVSDLMKAGYNCGVKTVEKGKFPIIFKKSYKSEIIVIKEDTRDNILWICGLATPSVLNKYQSEDLILSTNLRKRGTKTGFYGFHDLIHPQKIIDYLDKL